MREYVLSHYLNLFFFNSYTIFLHRILSMAFFVAFVYEFIKNQDDKNLRLVAMTGIVGLIPIVNINIFIQEYVNNRIKFEHYLILNKNCGVFNVIVMYICLCGFLVLSYLNYDYNKKITSYINVLVGISIYYSYFILRSFFIAMFTLCSNLDNEYNRLIIISIYTSLQRMIDSNQINSNDLENQPRPLNIDNYFEGVKIEQDSEESCSICLENYKKDCHMTTTECNHQFHTDCINGWISSKWSGEGREFPTCPVCRKSLEKSPV